MKETVLITGCTSGIGMHLTHEFAKNGHPVVLVAPDLGELQKLEAELKAKYGVATHVVPKDLELEESALEVFGSVERQGIVVDILVNNAGLGFRGKSWEIPIDVDISMVRLNIEAVLRLTKLFLPPMIERGRGKIMNTASVAGFEPGPMLNVYHSTKAFVLSYTEGLSVELEDTGITVTALCPGPTDTDFFPKADMVNVAAFQKGYVMAPQEVAEIGYKAVMEGEMLVVPGVPNKLLVSKRRVLSEHAQAKMNEKMYEEVSPEDRKRSRGDIEQEANA